MQLCHAVVFFMFWQGLIISALDSRGVIHKSVQFSDKVIADGLQARKAREQH